MSNALKEKAIEQVKGDKVICLHVKHIKSPVSTPRIALPDKQFYSGSNAARELTE